MQHIHCTDFSQENLEIEPFSFELSSVTTRTTYFNLIVAIFIAFAGVLATLALPSSSQAITVKLPLTIDFPLLSKLFIEQTFPLPGPKTYIAGDPQSCYQILAQNPKISFEHGMLRLDMQIYLAGGTDMGSTCFAATSWTGHMVFFFTPVFETQNFSLRFKTIQTLLFDSNGNAVGFTNVLFNLAKPKIQEYMDDRTIQLAPSIKNLRSFLTPLFPAQQQGQVQSMLASMRGGVLTLQGNELTIPILADVQEIYDPQTAEAKAALLNPISPDLISLWECWDSFLVELISDMAEHGLSPEDKEVLIDVLLDTRYAFSEALNEGKTRDDFVRKQFVKSWNELSPIFKKQIASRNNGNILSYLGLISAADSLVVLDRIGPTLGIEISKSGLERLAQMLRGPDIILRYNQGVDQRLRQLFDLPKVDENNSWMKLLTQPEPVSILDRAMFYRLADSALSLLTLSEARAAQTLNYDALAPWRYDGSDQEGFMKRVRELIAQQTQTVIKEKGIPENARNAFLLMIPAFAWQESCFRQFIEKEHKITYLLSYNHTSVGMMQVNERVWRGIYEQDRLRWDVGYNVKVGCEIVDMYLQRYALKKAGISNNPAFLASAVYAMYNGGPGQLNKFITRWSSKRLYKSDKLFAEKFSWVQNNQWDNISKCLGEPTASLSPTGQCITAFNTSPSSSPVVTN